MEHQHAWTQGFDGMADFDPAADFDTFLKKVPPRWVVYLMTGQGEAGETPVQLLCVKNLRQSLKRRLGTDTPGEPTTSKRVDYRGLVKRVYWRRVDSRFEADGVYLQAARQVFPESYRGMTGMRPAWFVHVDPDAPFPRYTKTTDLSDPKGLYLGPLEDKHAAARLIESVESAFDLCRYHHVLIEAPKGKACAYKEMGRCPAPCDGSLSLDQYRAMVELSTRVLVDPADTVRQHEARMRAAATELKFEIAGRIKQYVDELKAFGTGPFRHVRRLENFLFVVLQRGPREGTAKVFLVTQGSVTEEVALIAEPTTGSDVLRLLLETAESRKTRTVSPTQAETLAVVVHELFTPKIKAAGVFIPLGDVEERSIARAYRELLKQKIEEDTDESHGGEGVLRELQSL